MGYLLGLDIGGTSAKAAIFDESGAVVSQAGQTLPWSSPYPGWAERDMETVWVAAVDSVRNCISNSNRRFDVDAVAVVGHSDGLYAVMASGEPVGPAILAMDTRAVKEAALLGSGTGGAMLARLTGTKPFAGSPAALCTWLKSNEPGRLERARWLLYAKDWIRLRLTGSIATDPTDASSSFLDARTRNYSEEVLEHLGLSDLREKLPDVIPSEAVAGEISEDAAYLTGIRPGVPVVAGCHDVHAAAVGLSAAEVGDLSIVAGTFSINQILTNRLATDDRWQTRPSIEKGTWLAMSTSPTSASNFEWLSRILLSDVPRSFAVLDREVAESLYHSSDISYLPYLFGSPNSAAKASFMGMTGRDTRASLALAVYKGVVMNHRLHLNWLSEEFELPALGRLGGGAVHSETWTQLFADGLGMRLQVGDGLETARGAAAIAGVGIGKWPTVAEAGASMKKIRRVVEPQDGRAEEMDRSYQRFLRHRWVAERFEDASELEGRNDGE